MTNKIKSLLVTLSILTLTTFSVLASEKLSLFSPEVSAQISTGLALHDSYDVNFAAGVAVFPVKWLGVEAETPIYNTSGNVFSEVSFGAIVRVPIDLLLIRHFAPYVRGGEVYSFKNNADWTSYVGIGVETKIVKNWSVFTDGNYFFKDVSKFTTGNFVGRLGLRLSF